MTLYIILRWVTYCSVPLCRASHTFTISLPNILVGKEDKDEEALFNVAYLKQIT